MISKAERPGIISRPFIICLLALSAVVVRPPTAFGSPSCQYCHVPLISNIGQCMARLEVEDPIVVVEWRSPSVRFHFTVPLWWEPTAEKKENRMDILQRGYVDYDEEWIVQFAQKFSVDSLFVDVGANVGRTSFPIVCRKGVNHSVIAVEPVRRNIHSLCQSLFANKLPMGFGARYQLIEGAASENWGRMNIYVPVGRGDNAAMSAAAAVKNVGGQAPGEEVTTFPLDDYLAMLRMRGKMPPGGLRGIKIDTQGNELYVLKGLTKTLASAKQLAVFAENDIGLMAAAGVKQADIISLMRGHGFKAYCHVDVSVSLQNGEEVMSVRGTEQNSNEHIPCGDVIWIKQ